MHLFVLFVKPCVIFQLAMPGLILNSTLLSLMAVYIFSLDAKTRVVCFVNEQTGERRQ